MSSFSGAMVPCRDASGEGEEVLTVSLLPKAAEVVVPVWGAGAEDELPPVLTASKQSGPLAMAVKEACSITFPMMPSMTAGAEARSILGLALPMIMTGLLFLGLLVGLALAIGFANITGYSVLSGLAMSMEPICRQAFGAGHYELLGITMQRTVFVLVAASVPIGAICWVHIRSGQDAGIAAVNYLLGTWTMSTNRGSRVTATGLVLMLLAVSAGVGSGESDVLLGFALVGVLVGANLVAVGVTMRDEPTAPIGLVAFARVDALTEFLRRNLAITGVIMASAAVTAVAGGEAGQVLCLAMFALLLVAVSFVNIRILGD